ncbi:CLUMA_CG014949, isoform A [Clunio marinus]|uniref:CLUMA_CG014949, isoform A n=1 Tax=Clunio marinus TaxID=568069 RepID=A0A1J1INC7_9DIPT|nr:CLUMA_CG014949, isoform A [Clunio marinus]
MYHWVIPKPLILVYCSCALLDSPHSLHRHEFSFFTYMHGSVNYEPEKKPPKRVRELLLRIESNVGIYWSDTNQKAKIYS